MSKLIIMRGNSGCGKSSTAKLVREQLGWGNTALIEQDYVRRTVLGEKHPYGGEHHVDLMEMMVKFSLDRGFDVILEGILHKEYYSQMLRNLFEYNKESYLFYFDVSLEETLRRHTTKPNAHEFGEKEIRSWYRENEQLGWKNETVIFESITQADAVMLILDTIT